MSEIKRRRSKFEKSLLYVISLIFAAAVGAVVTWYVNDGLANSEKTKVYDYAYIEKSEPSHKWDGEAKCWNGIGSRSDTYKCVQQSRIYEPCFRDDISNDMKCPLNPKNNDGAKYFHAEFADASEPLMSSYGKEPAPWYIYLASGEKCRFVYGATTTIANKRMDFTCENSKMTLYLPVKDSGDSMKISCQKQTALEQCDISEILR